MLRVQASIISQNGDLYEVEARAEGCETPYTFTISAKNETEAAMQAIRRVEGIDSFITQSTRCN
jgi:hypothetical protein